MGKGSIILASVAAAAFFALSLAPGAPAAAQEAALADAAPDDTAANAPAGDGVYVARPQAAADTSPLTPEKKESLRKLTSLFMLTVVALIIVVVALIFFGMTFRRRMRDLERQEKRKVTELEDLWWKSGGQGRLVEKDDDFG